MKFLILFCLLLPLTLNSQTIHIDKGDTLICITPIQMDKVNITFMELHSCEKELSAMTDAYLDYKQLCSLQDSISRALYKQVDDCQSITIGLQYENQKLVSKYNQLKEEQKRKRRIWIRNSFIIGGGGIILGLILSIFI